MPAQELHIQPTARNKPLKPNERAALKQHMEAQAQQAAYFAAQQEAANAGDIAQYAGVAPAQESQAFQPVAPVTTPAPAAVAQPFPVNSPHPMDILAGTAQPVQQNGLIQQVNAIPEAAIIVVNPVLPAAPTPPATMQQYRQQHYGADMPFPDIADIFQGRSEEKPLNGIPLAPLPPPPPQVQHITVVHEVPAKIAGYRLTRAADVYIGSNFIHFDQGQIIYEPWIIEALVAGGFEALAPVAEAANFLRCPQCSHEFPEQVGRQHKGP